MCSLTSDHLHIALSVSHFVSHERERVSMQEEHVQRLLTAKTESVVHKAFAMALRYFPALTVTETVIGEFR